MIGWEYGEEDGRPGRRSPTLSSHNDACDGGADQLRYTRSEFCDESRGRVFRSVYDPKRVGGLCYATDMAKMGEFMADPSFAAISEVMKFDMSSMVMKVMTPMPPPPAA